MNNEKTFSVKRPIIRISGIFQLLLLFGETLSIAFTIFLFPLILFFFYVLATYEKTQLLKEEENIFSFLSYVTFLFAFIIIYYKIKPSLKNKMEYYLDIEMYGKSKNNELDS